MSSHPNGNSATIDPVTIDPLRPPKMPVADLAAGKALTPEPVPAPVVPAALPPKNKRVGRVILLAIAAAAVIGGLAYGIPYLQRSVLYTETDDAFIDGDIVTIAPHTSGYIDQLKVQDNQHVQAGDLLASVDPRDTSVRLRLAQAGRFVAENQYKQALATVDEDVADAAQKTAQIDASLARKEFADTEEKRLTDLIEGAASKTERANAVSTAKAAAADVEAARAALSSANAKIANAKAAVLTALAEVKAAEVGVEQEQLAVSYTQIAAPVTGRITRRAVQKGSYVVNGQSLLAIVPDQQWVTANFKETQLSGMKAGPKGTGSEVEIYIDAYPNRPLKGHVDSIQRGTGARFSLLPPENATGNFVKVVQRVPVKIAIDEAIPDDMVLAPGMSVVPAVKVK